MINPKESTETKETAFKGSLITALNNIENIDLSKLPTMELQLIYEWPKALLDFFDAYSQFFEGLDFEDFIHKELLIALESHVDLNLMTTQFGVPLMNLIHKLREQLNQELKNNE